MWTMIFTAALLIIFTIFIHALATRLVMVLPSIKAPKFIRKFPLRGTRISIVVLIMFFASILEAMAWAWSYYYHGALDTFEDALYFSIVTFTTLGYGDITLSDQHRLFASFEAANGIIVFGWSTALIMAVVQKLYRRR